MRIDKQVTPRSSNISTYAPLNAMYKQSNQTTGDQLDTTIGESKERIPEETNNKNMDAWNIRRVAFKKTTILAESRKKAISYIMNDTRKPRIDASR